MNDSDEYPTSFLEEMKDVSPIQQDKVHPVTISQKTEESKKYRQLAAAKKLTPYKNFLTDGEVEPVAPEEVLFFKTSGIQPNVFKNLKLGKYRFDYHLDLHGMTVSEARQAVFKLISSSEVDEIRCFLITHGKGVKSPQPAKLKSYVNHWLRQIEQVIAFHSALPAHGGSGSIYVLLKKPKQRRKINQAKYD